MFTDEVGPSKQWKQDMIDFTTPSVEDEQDQRKEEQGQGEQSEQVEQGERGDGIDGEALPKEDEPSSEAWKKNRLRKSKGLSIFFILFLLCFLI